MEKAIELEFKKGGSGQQTAFLRTRGPVALCEIDDFLHQNKFDHLASATAAAHDIVAPILVYGGIVANDFSPVDADYNRACEIFATSFIGGIALPPIEMYKDVSLIETSLVSGTNLVYTVTPSYLKNLMILEKDDRSDIFIARWSPLEPDEIEELSLTSGFCSAINKVYARYANGRINKDKIDVPRNSLGKKASVLMDPLIFTKALFVELIEGGCSVKVNQ
jgi:hypothetical protein